MGFHLIDMHTWVRKEHYSAYTSFLKMNWSVTVELDITQLLPELKRHALRLYPTMLYLATTAVNRNRAFKMAYDADGNLGYYDEVHTGYTIFHADDQTFSDIWTTYDADYTKYYAAVVQDMEQYKDCKGYKTKPNAPPNRVPISMTPWLQFTSCSFDTFQPAQMLQPIITFGKFFSREQHIFLPTAITANHAVADGWHAACLTRDLQSLISLLSEDLKK